MAEGHRCSRIHKRLVSASQKVLTKQALPVAQRLGNSVWRSIEIPSG